MARVVHLDALERLPLEDGQEFLAVRHALGVTAVGVNAFRAAAAGAVVVEPHDETSPNAGRHEELYVVLTGHATFTIGEERHEAPAGTFVRADVGEFREAVARDAGTTVLVIGAQPGAALPPSPFEWWYRAAGVAAADDDEAALAIIAPGLEVWPDNAGLHYEHARHHARAGRTELAREHLERALAGRPDDAERAAADPDLAALLE